METVHIKINNVPYEVAAGSTILEAAHSVGIEIPTLCYLKEINEIGACRICVVEVKGARSLVTACVYPVNEGMEIVTNSEKVQASRKTNLELLLSTHDQNCLSCVRSTDCELQKLCRDYGVNGMRFIGSRERYAIDDSAPHMVRDDNKCILCRRCVAACKANQAVGVIGANERGFSTHIGCAFEAPLGDSLRFLRPVHHRVSHRRADGKRRHRQGVGRAARPVQACCGAARAQRARHLGRMLRHAHRHQRGGQNGRRAAPPGL